jgi:hypothetical protein
MHESAGAINIETGSPAPRRRAAHFIRLNFTLLPSDCRVAK